MPHPLRRRPPEPAPRPQPQPRAKADDEAAKLPPVIDPTQWWGALTQQFTQLAANAMKDTATDAAKQLAGALVKPSFDITGDAVRKAAAMPGAVADKGAGKAAKAPAGKKVAAPSRSTAAARKRGKA